MKIFIYGDSNTWGYVPDVNGYSKSATPHQYAEDIIWWHKLKKYHQVFVNALCGRAIRNENPWCIGRNATKTIINDINKNLDADLIILQLGTNDCKTQYNLTAQEITTQLQNLIKKIQSQYDAKIMIISPAKITPGTLITNKYYVGADKKCILLDKLYKKLAQENNYLFVSGLNAEVGEDGEHLTPAGHKFLSQNVLKALQTAYKTPTRK